MPLMHKQYVLTHALTTYINPLNPEKNPAAGDWPMGTLRSSTRPPNPPAPPRQRTPPNTPQAQMRPGKPPSPQGRSGGTGGRPNPGPGPSYPSGSNARPRG